MTKKLKFFLCIIISVVFVAGTVVGSYFLFFKKPSPSPNHPEDVRVLTPSEESLINAFQQKADIVVTSKNNTVYSGDVFIEGVEEVISIEQKYGDYLVAQVKLEGAIDSSLAILHLTKNNNVLQTSLVDISLSNSDLEIKNVYLITNHFAVISYDNAEVERYAIVDLTKNLVCAENLSYPVAYSSTHIVFDSIKDGNPIFLIYYLGGENCAQLALGGVDDILVGIQVNLTDTYLTVDYVERTQIFRLGSLVSELVATFNNVYEEVTSSAFHRRIGEKYYNYSKINSATRIVGDYFLVEEQNTVPDGTNNSIIMRYNGLQFNCTRSYRLLHIASNTDETSLRSFGNADLGEIFVVNSSGIENFGVILKQVPVENQYAINAGAEFTYYSKDMEEIITYKASNGKIVSSLDDKFIAYSLINHTSCVMDIDGNVLLNSTDDYDLVGKNYNSSSMLTYLKDSLLYSVINESGEFVFENSYTSILPIDDKGQTIVHYEQYDLSAENPEGVNEYRRVEIGKENEAVKINNYCAEFDEWLKRGLGIYITKRNDVYSVYNYDGTLLFDNISSLAFSKEDEVVYLTVCYEKEGESKTQFQAFVPSIVNQNYGIKFNNLRLNTTQAVNFVGANGYKIHNVAETLTNQTQQIINLQNVDLTTLHSVDTWDYGTYQLSVNTKTKKLVVQATKNSITLDQKWFGIEILRDSISVEVGENGFTIIGEDEISSNSEVDVTIIIPYKVAIFKVKVGNDENLINNGPIDTTDTTLIDDMNGNYYLKFEIGKPMNYSSLIDNFVCINFVSNISNFEINFLGNCRYKLVNNSAIGVSFEIDCLYEFGYYKFIKYAYAESADLNTATSRIKIGESESSYNYVINENAESVEDIFEDVIIPIEETLDVTSGSKTFIYQQAQIQLPSCEGMTYEQILNEAMSGIIPYQVLQFTIDSEVSKIYAEYYAVKFNYGDVNHSRQIDASEIGEAYSISNDVNLTVTFGENESSADFDYASTVTLDIDASTAYSIKQIIVTPINIGFEEEYFVVNDIMCSRYNNANGVFVYGDEEGLGQQTISYSLTVSNISTDFKLEVVLVRRDFEITFSAIPDEGIWENAFLKADSLINQGPFSGKNGRAEFTIDINKGENIIENSAANFRVDYLNSGDWCSLENYDFCGWYYIKIGDTKRYLINNTSTGVYIIGNRMVYTLEESVTIYPIFQNKQMKLRVCDAMAIGSEPTQTFIDSQTMFYGEEIQFDMQANMLLVTHQAIGKQLCYDFENGGVNYVCLQNYGEDDTLPEPRVVLQSSLDATYYEDSVVVGLNRDKSWNGTKFIPTSANNKILRATVKGFVEAYGLEVNPAGIPIVVTLYVAREGITIHPETQEYIENKIVFYNLVRYGSGYTYREYARMDEINQKQEFVMVPADSTFSAMIDDLFFEKWVVLDQYIIDELTENAQRNGDELYTQIASYADSHPELVYEYGSTKCVSKYNVYAVYRKNTFLCSGGVLTALDVKLGSVVINGETSNLYTDYIFGEVADENAYYIENYTLYQEKIRLGLSKQQALVECGGINNISGTRVVLLKYGAEIVDITLYN